VTQRRSRHRSLRLGERIVVVVLVAIGGPLGCSGKKAPPPPVESGDGGSRRPADHLTADEAPQGTAKAFALPLPRASSVSVRFPTSIHVQSTLAPETLANYVRARVKSGRVLVGATMTRFEDVIVPAEPTRHLTIEIRRGTPLSGTRSEMVVTDVTPPPPPAPNESEADLRRKAGLTPDGKLLDPKHMQ
jgi:hypothetical protein